MRHSSGFAGMGSVTFGVMGGKSGNDLARNGRDVARWAAKTARLGGDAAASTRLRMRLRGDEVGMMASISGLRR